MLVEKLSRDGVLQRVKQVVIDDLGRTEGEVVETASFTDDLQADSLDVVELILALETEFNEYGLDVPDNEASELKTVGQVVDYIYKKINS